MSIDPLKIFIQRFDDMFNRPDLSIVDEIFTPIFVAHVPLMPMLNRSNYKGFWQSFYAAFPDFRQNIHDSIMTADKLVLRVTFSGTHEGNFLGIPATGCPITIPGIFIFRVENHLVVENWTEMDIFGVVRQISEMPSPPHKALRSIN